VPCIVGGPPTAGNDTILHLGQVSFDDRHTISITPAVDTSLGPRGFEGVDREGPPATIWRANHSPRRESDWPTTSFTCTLCSAIVSLQPRTTGVVVRILVAPFLVGFANKKIPSGTPNLRVLGVKQDIVMRDRKRGIAPPSLVFLPDNAPYIRPPTEQFIAEDLQVVSLGVVDGNPDRTIICQKRPQQRKSISHER